MIWKIFLTSVLVAVSSLVVAATAADAAEDTFARISGGVCLGSVIVCVLCMFAAIWS